MSSCPSGHFPKDVWGNACLSAAGFRPHGADGAAPQVDGIPLRSSVPGFGTPGRAGDPTGAAGEA
ncbi:hypothetical protein [Bilophila sp.]|uniref:hypothetical protein n=1 Tax=Bilophila sp. TaxID=1929485 RepID=UPI003076B41E